MRSSASSRRGCRSGLPDRLRGEVARMEGLLNEHRSRENNLREVSLDIPQRKLTVFTGVSGSG